MRSMRGAVALMAGLLGGSLAPAAAGAEETILLQPFVWEAYQEYASLFRPGVFAVSRDGTMYGYSYCPEVRCTFNSGRKAALESCEENGGEDCLVFAFQRDIRVAYQVLELEAAGRCPKTLEWGLLPSVVVVADIDPVVYDHSRDIGDLTEMHKRGKARVRPVDFELLGMTVHEFSEGEDSSGGTVNQAASGAHCAGMAAGTVRLRMKTTIYVASDFPIGSCLHAAVLAHEERHHEVGTRLFRALAADATSLLQADRRTRPYIEVADPGMAGAVARARIDAALSEAALIFHERYDAEQELIDTDDEFDSIAADCAAAQPFVE